ncbi:beta-lactamase family protein [Cnuibacter physcomitrellae]|uniref:serine hydrolase domain-containing protein n=1 Tax=Cnuibacter physcomitrellae TaxID=1619308 RepID=UPI002175856B|nr:serine hydrolase domain-containing protein [Cnuibacter physcomitrellae]MCS5497428.1 beta-lactamase family protein [Cnuibacter physcomitrellae]
MSGSRWAGMTAAVAAALLVMAPLSPATAAPEPAEHDVTMTAELQARIDGMVRGFLVDNPSVPGISVAVVTPDPAGPDPVITTFSAGVEDRTSGVPVQATTQFELGSETKVFTADLLAYLVATGTVSLDDPIQEYAPAGVVVPEWEDPETHEKTPITLLDLATHTAGLTDAPPNLEDGCPDAPEKCANPKPGYTPSMLWESFSTDCADTRRCPLWKPGTAWNYSNWGFALLGDIVAGLVTPGPVPSAPTGPGEVFQASLETTFLNELGMTSTTVEFPDTTPATPYDGDAPTYRWDNYDAYVGGGGLISNADDMGAYVAASLGYLPADAPSGLKAVADSVSPVLPISQTCTPTVPAPTPPASPTNTCEDADFHMGLGWERYPARAEGITVPYAHKNGGTEGSSTDTLLAPSLHVGVSSMFNQNEAGIAQLAPRILSLLIESQASPLPAADPSLANTGAGAIGSGLTAAAFLFLGVAAVLVRRRTGARS